MPKANLLGLVVSLLITFFGSFESSAQQPAKRAKFEVETKWPGIVFGLVKVERIIDHRLLVVIRIVATARAPASGTVIGIKPPIPPDATMEDRRSGRYDSRPFSLSSSVMIDDVTSQRSSALPPIYPPGKEYAPAEILAYLTPGRAEVLTLQFKAPPWSDGVAPGKQTVSLLLTNAKAPMMGVPVPPADAKELSVQR
jgi:hypothetical protein